MSLPHALLGLLSYHPATGYELKAVFEQSIHFFWNATLPQIYRTLNQMREQGWVTVTVEHQEGRPSRKVYRLTEAGREELRRWLAAPPEIPQPRDPLLVKVFFGRKTDPEVLAAHLKMWRAHYAGLLRRYEEEIVPLIHHFAALTGACEDARYWSLTLEFGRRFARMAVDWCDAALAVVMQEDNAHG
jgi:DNA-binding PadR family transcriptional regulator